MKKALIILAVVLVVLLCVTFFVVRSIIGITNSARLVPSDTVVYAVMPDLISTALRWPHTALAKISSEPEVLAFMEKPMSAFHAGQGKAQASNAGNAIARVKPIRGFIAVTSITPQKASMVAGFHYFSTKADLDDVFLQLRQQASGGLPPAALETETYSGDEIKSGPDAMGILYTASHGRWAFLSNDSAAIRDALDRAAGRKKTDPLSENPLYVRALAKSPGSPDFMLYCQPQPLVDAMLAVGQSMGAQPIPPQIDNVRKVQAISWAMRFSGEDIRDTIFIQEPTPPAPGSLTHSAAKFSSPDTEAYFDFLVSPATLSNLGTIPVVAKFAPWLSQDGVVQNITAAYGPECAISANWPAGQFRPGFTLALQVRDEAKANALLQQLTTAYPDTVVSQQGGMTFYSLPALSTPLTNPAFVQQGGFLVAGLDAGAITDAMKMESLGKSLQTSPSFAPALPAYHSANEIFGYIDTKALFERAYAALRPVIIFGAALMPTAASFIDSSKLPPAEVISRHLHPIIYSQTRLSDGYFIESTGPITFNQAALIGALATAAAGRSGATH